MRGCRPSSSRSAQPARDRTSASSSVIVASNRCRTTRTARLFLSSPTCGPRYSSKARTGAQTAEDDRSCARCRPQRRRGDGRARDRDRSPGTSTAAGSAAIRSPAGRRDRCCRDSPAAHVEGVAQARIDAAERATSRPSIINTAVLPGWRPGARRATFRRRVPSRPAAALRVAFEPQKDVVAPGRLVVGVAREAEREQSDSSMCLVVVKTWPISKIRTGAPTERNIRPNRAEGDRR